VPGSARAALESLVAIEATLGHALETLAGPYDHSEASAATGSMVDDFASPTIASIPAAPPASTSPGDQADPWRDLPHPDERGIEDRS
jgi:hypothetical protein